MIAYKVQEVIEFQRILDFLCCNYLFLMQLDTKNMLLKFLCRERKWNLFYFNF